MNNVLYCLPRMLYDTDFVGCDPLPLLYLFVKYYLPYFCHLYSFYDLSRLLLSFF